MAPVLPPVDEPVGKRRLEWTRECMPVLPLADEGAMLQRDLVGSSGLPQSCAFLQEAHAVDRCA